jgi:hypothetical protein
MQRKDCRIFQVGLQSTQARSSSGSTRSRIPAPHNKKQSTAAVAAHAEDYAEGTRRSEPLQSLDRERGYEE